MNLHECCSFRKMYTPMMIHVLFWIGVVLTTVSGLIHIITGLATNYGGGLVLCGLVTLLIGPIIIRVICELILVSFRVLETLTEIRDHMVGPGATTTTTTATPSPSSSPTMGM